MVCTLLLSINNRHGINNLLDDFLEKSSGAMISGSLFLVKYRSSFTLKIVVCFFFLSFCFCLILTLIVKCLKYDTVLCCLAWIIEFMSWWYCHIYFVGSRRRHYSDVSNIITQLHVCEDVSFSLIDQSFKIRIEKKSFIYYCNQTRTLPLWTEGTIFQNYKDMIYTMNICSFWIRVLCVTLSKYSFL